MWRCDGMDETRDDRLARLKEDIGVVLESLAELQETRTLADVAARGNFATLAPDGTIVFMDNLGIVYALTPQGSPIWSHSTGGSGWSGPVAVRADGTLIAASNPLGPMIHVQGLSASGSPLWTFPDESQKVIAGPSVGPDGNVFIVNDTVTVFCAVLPPLSVTRQRQIEV